MPARLRAPRTTGTLKLEGPLFTKDPGKSFDANVRDLMDQVAAAGADDARARIASIPPHGVRTGRTREQIIGRTRSRTGKRWASTAVIGIPRIGTREESIRDHAAIAEIEKRHHVMRDTAHSLRRLTDPNVGELLRGIS